MIIFVLAFYLLPESTFATVVIGAPPAALGRLSRFTWTVFAALLATWPVLLYQTRHSVTSRRADWSKFETLLFFFALLVSPYAAWYLGREALWPWLYTRLGQPHGAGIWLGFDALSLLFKSEAILITFLVTVVGPYRRTLFPRAFLIIVAAFLLLPPYVLALTVLFWAGNALWASLPGKWKLILLALPIAIGRSEVMQGLWPWGAILLSALFLVVVIAVKLIAGAIPKFAWEQAREIRTSTQPAQLSVPLVDIVEQTLGPTPTPRPPQPKSAPEPVPVVDERAVQEMLKHLKDALKAPSELVRCQAIQALGQTEMSEHIEILVPFLAPDGRSQKERLSAVEALGMIGGDEAINALLPLVNDANLAVRWRAQEVLEILISGKKLAPARRSIVAQEEPLVRVIS